MKLLCLGTGENVQVGDELRCLAGILEGHLIQVEKITEPGVVCRHGAIEFTVGDNSRLHGQYQFPPGALNCIWIGDHSVVTSIAFDNEHSVGHVIKEAVIKLCEDSRDVVTILVGEREWDQLRDLASVPAAPSSGTAPKPSFFGVCITRLPHRDTCLAFEHAPVEGEKFTCYECEEPCYYLFGDSRCGGCTQVTPEEAVGKSE